MRVWFAAAALVLMCLWSGASSAGEGSTGSFAKDGVRWTSGDELYLAGREVIVSEDVKGSVTATGDTLLIPGSTQIGGNAWLAGRNIAVSGNVGKNLELRGADAIVNGTVKGDVLFYGGKLTLGPDANVGGSVRYYSTTPAEIDGAARVGARVESHVLASGNDDPEGKTLQPQPRPLESFTERDLVWLIPGYGLSIAGATLLGILAIIVVVVLPGSATRLYEVAEEAPALTLLIGALWLFALPILAIVAAVTIIGIPVALLLLLLWPIGIIFGLLAAVLMIGGYAVEVVSPGAGLRTKGIVAAVAGTFLLWFGMVLPIVGGVVWFIATIAGIGALALSGRTPIVVD